MIKRADADANGKLVTFDGTFTRIRHLLSKVPYEDYIPNYYRCAGPIGCPEATQPPSRGSRAAAGRARSGVWRAPARLKGPGRCYPICGQGMLLDLRERLPIVAASITAPGGQTVGAAGG
jgi:hypothetical protein